jgi:hypothetical protein
VTRAHSDLLRRRLTPLYAAAFLQNLALWVPIEGVRDALVMWGLGAASGKGR